jgi:hypothetical protein
MPKKIVVFADGTGNAFSTQESNVWRLYSALDQSLPDQIAHYIKGVGTSGFKPFALLDGATGVGVPSNVRKLYRFICWNWKPDDEIYMFGFSRGAFTIRTLVGLIQSQGLVPTEIGDETVTKAEMRRNAMAAWRAYRSATTSWFDTFITITIVRMLRNIVLACVHLLGKIFYDHRFYRTVEKETASQRRTAVPITFIGLFDTVEAFGVPIEEFRRAIDFAIWPISFRNRVLCDNVAEARHALSLDDERETFHPVRFDREKSRNPERIKEVWFAGMHSDVGGGYPEDDLAHVPLNWMVQELGPRLRFIPGVIPSLAAQASAYAPIHDSRSGLSVFYRYSPRDVGNNRGPPVIHHSVAEKIAFGVERYAPVTLPETAGVLMPDGSTRTIRGFVPEAHALRPLRETAQGRAERAVRALAEPSPALVALTRDQIWERRVAYYALLLMTFAVASLPWTARPIVYLFRDCMHQLTHAIGASIGNGWDSIWDWLSGTDQGSSAFVGSIFQYVGTLLPGYAKPWSDAFIDKPWCCGIVTSIALYLYWKSSSLRDAIADLARQAWMPTERAATAVRQAQRRLHTVSLARRLRTSRLSKFVSALTSRFVLPAAAIAVIFLTIAVSISRSVVTFREGSGALCTGATTSLQRPDKGETIVRDNFRTDAVCWSSGIGLHKGYHYELTIEMVEPFFDQAQITDINGFTDHSTFRHLSGQLILRWWTAAWFQPIAKVDQTGSDALPLTSAEGDAALPVGQDINRNNIPALFYEDKSYEDRLAQLNHGPADKDPSRLAIPSKIPDDERAAANTIETKYALRRVFVSRFTAPADGELMLYVNDAIAALPFFRTYTGFYDNNSGTAKVSLKRLEAQ